jgi:hypothetical protein
MFHSENIDYTLSNSTAQNNLWVPIFIFEDLCETVKIRWDVKKFQLRYNVTGRKVVNSIRNEAEVRSFNLLNVTDTQTRTRTHTHTHTDRRTH